jgi:hypothetical protein
VSPNATQGQADGRQREVGRVVETDVRHAQVGEARSDVGHDRDAAPLEVESSERAPARTTATERSRDAGSEALRTRIRARRPALRRTVDRWLSPT